MVSSCHDKLTLSMMKLAILSTRDLSYTIHLRNNMVLMDFESHEVRNYSYLTYGSLFVLAYSYLLDKTLHLHLQRFSWEE